MTVLLGRMLNGVCWAVNVVLRPSSLAAPSNPNQSAILAATL